MLNREVEETIRRFVKERDWEQFHNPKDLAISLSLEANELLELFQWSGSDLEVKGKRDAMKEELADVFAYAFMMADAIQADPKEIILEKMGKNAAKYPVEKAYGSSKKYDEL